MNREKWGPLIPSCSSLDLGLRCLGGVNGSLKGFVETSGSILSSTFGLTSWRFDCGCFCTRTGVALLGACSLVLGEGSFAGSESFAGFHEYGFGSDGFCSFGLSSFAECFAAWVAAEPLYLR